ncbi:MAG: 4a-hydroxytetrahydrobiopterin dehydratase, partial [Planctomycetota bacterium]|nr:4a-hydroxytetrahydrobiopterin dehydratase [Planctomycetota bacterium]
MNELSGRDCVPCRGGVPPLEETERETLKAQLDPDWEVVEGHHLQREFQFEDFRTAMDFTVRVGEMAETQGHHPDL